MIMKKLGLLLPINRYIVNAEWAKEIAEWAKTSRMDQNVTNGPKREKLELVLPIIRQKWAKTRKIIPSHNVLSCHFFK